MSTSFFDVIFAALPPLSILILMVGFRWGGSQAGAVGWIIALILAIVHFGATGKVLFYAHIRSIVLTIDVVYIVWSALLLYLVVDEADALRVIANWFTALTGDDMLRVLLLGWVLASFLQGVGGFGVPVAITAPLLVGLGLSPLVAVVVPSIGHAWAVTFGSLGSSFIALTGVTGLDADFLSPPAAVLLGAAAFGCGLLAAHAYGGTRGMIRALPAVAFIGAAMATTQYIVATSGLWNIAAASGGLAGLAAGLWVTRWSIYSKVAPTPPQQSAEDENSSRPVPSFPIAISGYVILVILAVLITGVTPIKDAIGSIKPAVTIPEVETSNGWITSETPDLGIKIFAHTGAVLIYSAVIAYWIFRRRGYYLPGVESRIIKGVWKRGLRPAIGILTMVCMATVMSNAGMTRTLAEWLSQSVPDELYAFVAVMIGALGAFMTGSNTNSNAVFAGLQMDTATLLGISVSMILAAQTASAAIASLLAPAKIMVGASTVGSENSEGVILRNLVAYGGILLAMIALLAFALIQLGY
jgi:lactate permease